MPDRRIEWAVLDVETVVSADAVRLAPRASGRGFGRRPLHRVVCASVLRFVEEEPHGEVSGITLQTFHAGRCEEHAIIGGIEAALPDPTAEDTRLLTWNGRSHDVVLLSGRAQALWMFGLPRLRGWTAAPSSRHVDAMLVAAGSGRLGDMPSLSDVSASLGFPHRPVDANRDVRRMVDDGDWDAVAARNRCDVVATFLVAAHQSSWRRGCQVPVASAWTALTDAVPRLAGRTRHLDPFATNVLASLGRRRLAEHRSGAIACHCVPAPSVAASRVA